MISRRSRKRRTRRLLPQTTTGDNRKRSRNSLRKSRRGTTRSRCGCRITGLQQGTDNSRRRRMIRDIGEASGRARRRLEEILHGRCCQRYRVTTSRFCFCRCRSTRRWYEPLVDVTKSLINVTRIILLNYYTSLILLFIFSKEFLSNH